MISAMCFVKPLRPLIHYNPDSVLENPFYNTFGHSNLHEKYLEHMLHVSGVSSKGVQLSLIGHCPDGTQIKPLRGLGTLNRIWNK